MAKRLLSQLGLNLNRPPVIWARLGNVQGAASDTTYTDAAGVTWRCVQWTASNASGLAVEIPGHVDSLLIGGGSGGVGGGIGWAGGPGSLLDGLLRFSAGMHGVTVGAAGPAGVDQQPSSYLGGESKLGQYNASGGQVQIDGIGYRRGTEAWTGDGYGSAITGATVYYGGCGRWNGSAVAGKGYGVANSGSGAYVNEGGQAGRVIIRVPA